MTHGLLEIIGFVAALLSFCFAYRSISSTSRDPSSRLPLPPGPKGFPLIGNLYDIPKRHPWLTYCEWKFVYGDILSLNIFGKTMIVLGSKEAMVDLLDKRSSIYSSRVESTMLTELMGLDWNFALMPYGPSWRKHRKEFQQLFHHTEIPKYLPVQLKQARALLRRLLATPEDFAHLISLMVASTIMEIAYGIDIKETSDEYITIAEQTELTFNEAADTGPFLVDLIPVLKYVPAWMPGAYFQRLAARAKYYTTALADKPFEAVKAAMTTKNAPSSMATMLLEALPDGDGRSEAELLARNTCANIYSAGATTTTSALQFFIMAIVLNPEAQKRAQAELDAVIGPDRLPNFDDYDSLPYIHALVKETVRWRPIIPIDVPHCTSSDDEYKGYSIPKGSIVFANSWSVLHDPDTYPEPDKFLPERYLKDGKLDSTVPDHHSAAFGFGRRICPGRFFADNSLFITMASVLHVFEIGPAHDEQGNPINVVPDVVQGTISTPIPFQCSIKPRHGTPIALKHLAHIRGSDRKPLMEISTSQSKA